MSTHLPIDTIILTKHFISLDAWSAGWFMFHAEDSERLDFLRKNGFSHIVVIESDLDREEFDRLIDSVMTDAWTKFTEVTGVRPGPRFRHTIAAVRAADAIMAKMVGR